MNPSGKTKNKISSGSKKINQVPPLGKNKSKASPEKKEPTRNGEIYQNKASKGDNYINYS